MLDKCISDHYVVSFEINIEKPIPENRVIVSRGKIDDQSKLASDIKELIPTIKDYPGDKVSVLNCTHC